MFQAFAENGNLQIDALKSTLVLTEKIVMSTDTVPTTYVPQLGIDLPGGNIYTATATKAFDMVAFKMSTIGANCVIGGTQDAYKTAAQAENPLSIAVIGTPVSGQVVTAYCFGQAKNALVPGAVNYGMQLFNESGELVFDSVQSKLMRIAHNHVISNATQCSTRITLPTGRDYAYLAYGEYSREIDMLSGFWSPSANSFEAVGYFHFANRLYRRTQKIYRGGILAIDVTGY